MPYTFCIEACQKENSSDDYHVIELISNECLESSDEYQTFNVGTYSKPARKLVDELIG